MSVILTIIVVGAVFLWAIATYNRLMGLRNQVKNGWRQIDVELKRRHDLIANVVSTVRGTMDAERITLEAVMAARQNATTATGPADAAAKEAALSQTLGRLFALVEGHPQLSAHQNVRALQEELTVRETKLNSARHFYNAVATKYNAATQVVPVNFVAGFGNFPAAELFEAKDRKPPVPPVNPATQP